MKSHDYLPSNALALQNFLKNLRTQLSANRGRWEISEQRNGDPQ
jgi:hypothetical protein